MDFRSPGNGQKNWEGAWGTAIRKLCEAADKPIGLSGERTKKTSKEYKGIFTRNGHKNLSEPVRVPGTDIKNWEKLP